MVPSVRNKGVIPSSVHNIPSVRNKGARPSSVRNKMIHSLGTSSVLELPRRRIQEQDRLRERILVQ